LNRAQSVATYRDESVEAKWSDIRQVDTLSNVFYFIKHD
jgi:hypothetical protein